MDGESNHQAGGPPSNSSSAAQTGTPNGPREPPSRRGLILPIRHASVPENGPGQHPDDDVSIDDQRKAVEHMRGVAARFVEAVEVEKRFQGERRARVPRRTD